MSIPAARPGALLHAVLALIALAAVALPAWVVATVPRVVVHPHHLRVVRPPQRIVPPAELPPVEPIQFQDLSPEDARIYNAGMPFSSEPNPPARPFLLRDDQENLARAVDCLSAAEWYEAGDDPEGEKAVAQVVLNRVRHPAFPQTVCGVVFQGSERATGCQFTFTCDGALARTPSDLAWHRAQELAQAALSGKVYKPVGYATHYHTDWVVPYWQASLDKIAEVHTHLFFRWSGWWGTPPAFGRAVDRTEPTVPALARISDAHRLAMALDDADAAIAGADAAVAADPSGRALQPLASNSNMFLAALDPADPDRFPAIADQACGDRPKCVLMGWTDPTAIPSAVPLSDDQAEAMAFSYMRDRSFGFERTLWNCTAFKRPDQRQCMKRRDPAAAAAVPPVQPAPAGNAPAPGPTPTPTPAPELKGVRRAPRSMWPLFTPRPKPTPTPAAPTPATASRPSSPPASPSTP